MSYPALNLLLILSLGRSGSTFLSKAIAENSDYVNCGENRFFWQRLLAKPSCQHAEEIARFFAKNNPEAYYVIDKTPDLYRYVDQIDFGEHCVHWIELVRSPEEIAVSRRQFVRVLRRPRRILLRMRKYQRDYGFWWFVPILQRWYFLLSILGFHSNRTFATGKTSVDVRDEYKAFKKVVHNIRNRTTVLAIDYNDFSSSVLELEQLGFSEAQISGVAAHYKR